MLAAPVRQAISFSVYGSTPQTKGSLRQWHRWQPGGRCQLGISEQAGERLKEWRALVATAAKNAMRHEPPFAGPVKVTLEFLFDRPKANHDLSAYAWGNKRWDVDKLSRAALDAIQDAAVLHDDSQVAVLEASKRYTDGFERPGVEVRIEALS